MCSRSWFEDHIRNALPELILSDEQLTSLYRHFELLNRWNERMDLTSVDTPEEIVRRHYCESLFFGYQVPLGEVSLSVLDFGSGAGFPGLPLAILNPNWRVTLLEANQRRAVFLKEAAREIANVSVIAERGEKFDQRHDFVVARAVNVPEVLRCIPRLANQVGLLIGESAISSLSKACKWCERVPIPWSESRCCIFGTFHVEHCGRLGQ